MREKISLLQFLVSLIIGIYVFIMFIYVEILLFNPNQFLFMTMWNFYLSTIYLIINSICDFSLFVLKSIKLEKLSELFRETLSPAFTALTFLVTFTFWVMIFPVILRDRGDGNFGLGLHVNLYVHLFLTIFQTIDIFLSYRINKGIKIKYDFLIAASIMGVYSILTLILIYGFNKAIYPFLENMTWYKAIFELILFQAMIFLFYLIHVGLIKLKYKCKIYIIFENDEKEELPDNEEDNSKEIN